jgi:purine-cytosine permease-like protein
MKSFLEWFKSSAKVKRWIFLIIIGITLVCYGFTKVLVTEEMSFSQLRTGSWVICFRIYLYCYWYNFYSKTKFRNYYRSK